MLRKTTVNFLQDCVLFATLRRGRVGGCVPGFVSSAERMDEFITENHDDKVETPKNQKSIVKKKPPFGGFFLSRFA